MNLHDRIRQLVDVLPPDAAVQLTAATLRTWLDDECMAPTPRPCAVTVDLTVTDVATMLKRKESTVRGWLGAGRIPEAYHLNGVEWRVPPAALERFLEEQRRGVGTQKRDRSQVPGRGKSTDLGAWRTVRKVGGAK